MQDARGRRSSQARIESIAIQDNVRPARPALRNFELAGESLGEFTDQDGIPRGRKEDAPGELELFGRNFARGDEAGIQRIANESDVAAISAVVNNASRLADFTIVTMHSHEYDRRRDASPEFLKVFARAMVEAGADVFVGHGPHTLRGIEIFQGKPILYSLGDFLFQNETLDRLPADNYDRYDLGNDAHVADFNDLRYEEDTKGFPTVPGIWEAVVAVPTFRNNNLSELALYPIDLGFGRSRQVRGRPLLAGSELSEKIIGDLQRLSEQYGTEIVMRRGVGYVQLENGN